ncbi:MAG: hypothetical protein KF708_20970 [Pirellulales bacterium]|nr:hypothetical protein [Pirellulales bacterium]
MSHTMLPHDRGRDPARRIAIGALALCLLASLVATGCKAPGTHNLPPATQLMHPGPGVDGPGPGVMMIDPGVPMMPPQSSQIAFVGPEGMIVAWDVSMPGAFDSEPLVCPGRYNFPQGAIYRLKLTSIPGRPGVELYPTLEVGPTMPRTDAYLAHNAIPVQVTEEDLDQVMTGNFVTKVIYLPDSEYQELAIAGVETLVSTRLDPGVDPIIEADRRGSIMAIFRLGNKDLQIPGAEGDGGMAMGGFGGGAMPAGFCGPGGGGGPGGGLPASLPGEPIAGVTSPQWGMPISGTPIGLPGPPHIPLGVPAGLQKHVITNHTHYDIPNPTRRIDMHVKQKPGFSYPRPANTVHIEEATVAPPAFFRRPTSDHMQLATPCGPECQ